MKWNLGLEMKFPVRISTLKTGLLEIKIRCAVIINTNILTGR
jgi:hypothetical protein